MWMNRRRKQLTKRLQNSFKQILFCKNQRHLHPLQNRQQETRKKSNAINQLEERLKQSEIDLFTSIGESEEYMRLYQSFPDMKVHLESQYLQARETSSKLLGQIKAIKSAITHQQK